MKTICIFGDFDPAYSRNRVIIRGLTEAGARVVLCHSGKKGIARMRDLIQTYRTLPSHDLVLVAYSDSRIMVPLAWCIARAPVVWDAFYSLYDTRVGDRGLVSVFNPKGWFYWLADFVSAHLARHVFLDTVTHATYFARTFFLPRASVGYMYVGTDERVFTPQPYSPKSDTTVTVGFYGKYIPLQGVEIIVKAADLLRDESNIHFILLGSGQTYPRVRSLVASLGLTNITFEDRVPYEDLPRILGSFDIALGIFGTSDKAARVIPNKVYEAMAMGKPIITANTEAARELLVDGENAVLIPPGDPVALAAAIRTLVKNPAIAPRIGHGARTTFLSNATPKSISEKFLAEIAERGI